MISTSRYAKYSNEPMAFFNDLNIDISGNVKRWGDVMDPFQRDDFQALVPGLLNCVGRKPDPTARMRAWIERPRGASKTSDQAAVVCWLLVFAPRPMKIVVYASDRDQAGILRSAVITLLRLNGWLGELLTVEQRRVVVTAVGHPGSGGAVNIEASDASSSYGQLVDAVVADEITHWSDVAGSELWSSVASTIAKRSNTLFLGICNSGFTDSWQWRLREQIRLDDAWIFSRLEGQASWMTEGRLEEQRRLLPPIAFARLWLNQWSSGGGDALSPEDIVRAFDDTLQPMTGREQGYVFVAGCDLGLVRDSSAVIVLGVPSGGRAGKIRLAAHRIWKPTPGHKVDLLQVEKAILDLDQQYGLEALAYDPWQAQHLIAALEADTSHQRRNEKRTFFHLPWAREQTPTAAVLRQQASLTIESFKDGRLQLFPCPDLRDDLNKLRVVERPGGGFRLQSPRDNTGYGDSASALCNCLTVAHEFSLKAPLIASCDPGPDYHDPDELLFGDAWEQRQRDYAAEMNHLAQGSSNSGGRDELGAMLSFMRNLDD